MTNTMIYTTKVLVDKTSASIGFVNSDEISLCWNGSEENTKLFFDGKIQKQCSVLAGLATSAFINGLIINFDAIRSIELIKRLPHFDIQMPSQTEVANMFLWREFDATKNAISMAARHYFSHKELQNKNGKEMIDMMLNINVKMDDFPISFRRGTFVKKVTEEKILTEEEYNKIPKKHRINIALGQPIIRSTVHCYNGPELATIQNREDFIFEK
jgi:tRNA(His) 5'-end guanylyltransferase